MPDQTNNSPNLEAVDNDRRELLRKAAWVAPVLVALGLAGRAGKAQAQLPPPPSAPS